MDEWTVHARGGTPYLRRREGPERRAAHMDGRVGGSRLRVLVVDDHDLFRAGLRTLLDEQGFEVAESSGAEAALRRLPSFAPHVVVMDLHMPGMDGVEATPRVLDASPGTAVFLLSGPTHAERGLVGVRAGAAGYLLPDAPR